jgi:hypothetical protein
MPAPQYYAYETNLTSVIIIGGWSRSRIMAKQDPGEPIDPAYKYIDGKIEQIKKELERLEESLLQTQRSVAGFRVDFEVHNIQTFLSKHPDLSTQLIHDASEIRAQIKESENPYELALQFHDEWVKKLQRLKVKLITF